MADKRQPEWFKSSYSGTPNNECVECASTLHHVLVRDSKDPEGPHFSISPQAWGQFTKALRANTLPVL
ncbi:DUF397 domain-containing protein [Streptomyces specialis]|uniref:DUF397 domain-containing protein n=1 Tax=Streptomyces specialis TaxID=498367 RepID=UPI00073E834C|nr:DUF397 domain-containing protein [Streptomyces specialis]